MLLWIRMPSISLSKRLGQVIKRLKASGRYHNSSEVVRAGLRLLEKHEINDYLNVAPLPAGTLEKIYAEETPAERQAERTAAAAGAATSRRAARNSKREER